MSQLTDILRPRMSRLMELLGSEQKPFEIVLPLDRERGRSVVKRLDGTADKILLETPEGKREVWVRMSLEPPLWGTRVTRIGDYEVPGVYKPAGYVR